MGRKKRLSLKDLKVQSFVTSLDGKDQMELGGMPPQSRSDCAECIYTNTNCVSVCYKIVTGMCDVC